MAEINKEITINAPVQKIFTYVSRPVNLPQIWPSLVQIGNEQLLPNGGYKFQWVYKMAGMMLEGTGEVTDIVDNQWIVVKTGGEIDSTITFTFRARGHETRVILTIEYRTPLPILNQLGKKIVEKINEQEANLILANLRAMFTNTRSPRP